MPRRAEESTPSSAARRQRSKTPVRETPKSADTTSRRSRTPSKKPSSKASESKHVSPAAIQAAPTAAVSPVPAPAPVPATPAPVDASVSRKEGELSIVSPQAVAQPLVVVPPAYNPSELLVFFGVLAAIAWASHQQAFDAASSFLDKRVLGLLQLIPSALITYVTLTTMRKLRRETYSGSVFVLYFLGMLIHCGIAAAHGAGLLDPKGPVTGQYIDAASVVVLSWGIMAYEHPQFSSKRTTALLVVAWLVLHFIVAAFGIVAVTGQPSDFWGAGRHAVKHVYLPASWGITDILDKVLPMASTLIAATTGARAVSAWQAGSTARYQLAAVAFGAMFIPNSPVLQYLLWPVVRALHVNELVFKEVAAWVSMYLLGASSL